LRIIALETSTRDASIALLHDDRLLQYCCLPADRRTTQSLAPAIRDALRDAGWSPSDVGLVALTNGPGSFTGLRIAVTTAKTFAYATGARLIAVNTLAAIATRLPAATESAGVVMNAQRGQWFAALYRRNASGVWTCIRACQVVDRRVWLNSLPPETLLTGPTADQFEGQMPAYVQLADRELWTPRADCVGQLAWRGYQQGRCTDPWTLVPNYYRLSYAEEKRGNVDGSGA